MNLSSYEAHSRHAASSASAWLLPPLIGRADARATAARTSAVRLSRSKRGRTGGRVRIRGACEIWPEHARRLSR